MSEWICERIILRSQWYGGREVEGEWKNLFISPCQVLRRASLFDRLAASFLIFRVKVYRLSTRSICGERS